MKDEFKNELYVLNNDDKAFFGLLHVVETFGFLEEIYILRSKGVVYYWNDLKNTNAIFRSIFNSIRYFFIQTDDTKQDKSNLAYKFFDKNYKDLEKILCIFWLILILWLLFLIYIKYELF